MNEEELASALQPLTNAIRDLGNGNASTPMGAIENLAKELRDGLNAVAISIESLAMAISENKESFGDDE